MSQNCIIIYYLSLKLKMYQDQVVTMSYEEISAVIVCWSLTAVLSFTVVSFRTVQSSLRRMWLSLALLWRACCTDLERWCNILCINLSLLSAHSCRSTASLFALWSQSFLIWMILNHPSKSTFFLYLLLRQREKEVGRVKADFYDSLTSYAHFWDAIFFRVP